jgi:hypothetical protein
MPLKESDSDLSLQRSNSRCHIGLNGIELGSCPVHTSMTSYGFEDLEVGSVHALHLYEMSTTSIKASMPEQQAINKCGSITSIYPDACTTN